MTAKVTVVEPDRYELWVESQKRLIAEAQRLAQEQRKAHRGGPRRGEPGRLERWRRPSTQQARSTPARPEISVRGLPERRAGWIDWVTTTDHKKIGILYLFTTLFFFLLGGVEALLMRIQLGSPDNTFLDPTTYNQLFTMHGTTMIFLVVVPIFAGFANYLVPLMIGARDMAFPRLNMLSWWLLVFGGTSSTEPLLLAAGGGLDVLRAAVRRLASCPATGSTPGSSRCISSGSRRSSARSTSS